MDFITDLNFMILACQLISGYLLFLFPISFKKVLKQEFPNQKKSNNNPYNAIRRSDQQLWKDETTTIRVEVQMSRLKCYMWTEDKWKYGSQKGVHYGRNYLMLVRNLPLAQIKKIMINFKQPKGKYESFILDSSGIWICQFCVFASIVFSCMLKLFYKYARYASCISKYFLLISVAVIKEQVIINH